MYVFICTRFLLLLEKRKDPKRYALGQKCVCIYTYCRTFSMYHILDTEYIIQPAKYWVVDRRSEIAYRISYNIVDYHMPLRFPTGLRAA